MLSKIKAQFLKIPVAIKKKNVLLNCAHTVVSVVMINTKK